MSLKTIMDPGTVFARLTVLGEAPAHIRKSDGRRDRMVACKCSCGNIVAVRPYCLTTGHTTSCGCFSREQIGERRRTHGQSGTLEYDAWMAMRKRCGNESDPRFDDYGGRGITVCDRWSVFENFLSDMGHRPTTKHTLERVNNDGNYELGNVVWATKTEQARNKRNTRRLTIDGVTKTLMEWCVEYSADYHVVHGRLKNKWEPKRALSAPISGRVSA